MAEAIEMPFWGLTLVGARNHVLDIIITTVTVLILVNANYSK